MQLKLTGTCIQLPGHTYRINRSVSCIKKQIGRTYARLVTLNGGKAVLSRAKHQDWRLDIREEGLKRLTFDFNLILSCGKSDDEDEWT